MTQITFEEIYNNGYLSVHLALYRKVPEVLDEAVSKAVEDAVGWVRMNAEWRLLNTNPTHPALRKYLEATPAP